MDIQNIIIYVIVGLAVLFLIRKFFWKKNSSKKSCGTDGDCGCH